MRLRRAGAARSNVQNTIAAVLVVLTTLSCAATYAAFNQFPPFGDDPDTVLWLLTLDSILLLALLVLIARRVVSLWANRKQGEAGSHLHVRLVYIFSVMAAVPAIIMTVFSVFFFNYGIQAWFSERVQTAVLESQEVAQAYLAEHKEVIRADTMAMANDIDRQATLFLTNKEAFERAIETQSFLRNLAEVVIFDATGRVIASSGLTFSLEYEEISTYALEQADNGEVALMTGANEDRVRALIRLDNFIGSTYLFVGRMLDPKVLSHLAATEKASTEYVVLQERTSRLQILTALIFTIIGLLLMFTAILLGFLLARQLVAPITDLITASERARQGDYSATIKERGKVEEFDYLAHAFNRMMQQIEEQQNDLLETNRQMDRRRRFTETVLAGATSGIVGVDSKGKITLANASAGKLLGLTQERLIGLKVRTLSAETDELLNNAHLQPEKVSEAEVSIQRSDIGKRIFLVRVAIELVDERDVGAIITFDDITDLQSAQRKAAWSDVARRVAHEIKNPLTPIQLSAERLKRKYLKEITNDPESFEACTDTIIRHVEDIGHMVNEFSAFARMPEAVMKKEDFRALVEDVIGFYRHAHPEIHFDYVYDEDSETLAKFDSKQMRQVLTNILQNAIDAVEDQKGKSADRNIRCAIFAKGTKDILFAVSDSGQGFPEGVDEAQLVEPYVTRKEKGTGLGLAIVKKIVVDHGGELLLSLPEDLLRHKDWKSLKGALVGFTLPKI